MLAADNFPKPRTLSDFRALHLQELAAPPVQVVKLARECGLVKLGTIAVDGTKLRAKASKHKAMSYERMQAREIELKAQIDTLLKRAAQTDKAEADEPELDIPAELALRQERLEVIKAAKQRLEARQRRRTHGAGASLKAKMRTEMMATAATAARAIHPRSPKSAATPSSARLACPSPRRKTTSPIPTAAS